MRLDKLLARRLIRERTTKVDDCWIWTGYVDKDGYGRVTIDYGDYRVSRISAWAFGILDDLGSKDFVCHKSFICKSKSCVNPEHLYVGDGSENQLDSVEAGTHKEIRKDVCPKGHEYTLVNTITEMGRSGRVTRRCRICTLDREAGRSKVRWG